jgi:hypothetical protein
LVSIRDDYQRPDLAIRIIDRNLAVGLSILETLLGRPSLESSCCNVNCFSRNLAHPGSVREFQTGAIWGVSHRR